jgi:hypothetical protein
MCAGNQHGRPLALGGKGVRPMSARDLTFIIRYIINLPGENNRESYLEI